MRPHGISQNKLAWDIDVPLVRVNGIIRARRAITADIALWLSAFFGTTPQFWMNLQSCFDLKRAERELGPDFARTIRPLPHSAARD